MHLPDGLHGDQARRIQPGVHRNEEQIILPPRQHVAHDQGAHHPDRAAHIGTAERWPPISRSDRAGNSVAS